MPNAVAEMMGKPSASCAFREWDLSRGGTPCCTIFQRYNNALNGTPLDARKTQERTLRKFCQFNLMAFVCYSARGSPFEAVLHLYRMLLPMTRVSQRLSLTQASKPCPSSRALPGQLPSWAGGYYWGSQACKYSPQAPSQKPATQNAQSDSRE